VTTEFICGKEIFSPKNRPIRYQLFANIANKAGGVAWIKFLEKKILIVSDPLVAKELYTKHASGLIRAGISNGIIIQMVGSSVLTVNGDEWLHLRQDINPSLSDVAVEAYLPLIVDSYVRRYDKWLERSSSGLISILPKDLIASSYYVKSRLIFGNEFNDNEVISLVDNDTSSLAYLAKIAPSGVNFPSWIPFSAKNSLKKITGKSVKILLKNLDDYLIRCGKGIVNTCILDSFYGERLARGRCPLQFGQQKQTDLIRTLFYSSVATTSTMVVWALRILSAKCQVLEIIKTEIDSLLTDDRSLPEVLPFMHKTRAFVLELMRCYPVIPSILKEAISDISCSFGVIPKGSAVIVSIHGIHTNPMYWQNPGEFCMDRFELNASHHETFWTFGLGSHACPGRMLAISEVMIVIALLIRRFCIVSQPSMSLDANCASIFLEPLDSKAFLLEPKL
jgi:cytochrome P450